MGSTDARSWYKVRLHLVSCRFQISAHLLENHSLRPINDSENVLAHDPARSNSPNNSEHCGPEVAVVGRTPAFAREAERLARETAGEYVDAVAPNGKVCCSYVFILFRFGKMILQYAPAERVDLAVEDVRPAGPRGRQVEAADTAE